MLLAKGLAVSDLQADDEEAGIKKVWIPRQDIAELISRGEIVDADTLSSLLIAGIV